MLKHTAFHNWSRRRFLAVSTGALGAVWPAPAAAEEPIVPRRTIRLFNGRDLSGLHTWVKGTGYKDPRKIFTVRDGILHVSGEIDGYAATRQAYRDYHLVVEYKWGAKTYNSKTVRKFELHPAEPVAKPMTSTSTSTCTSTSTNTPAATSTITSTSTPLR